MQEPRNTPDRRAAVAAICEKILHALADGPMDTKALYRPAGIDEFDPRERRLVQNCLTKLRMKGEIAHSLNGTWRLASGPPAPPAAQRPSAGSMAAGTAGPRDKAREAPSRTAPPPKLAPKTITRRPAPGRAEDKLKAGAAPSEAARHIADLRTANGAAKPHAESAPADDARDVSRDDAADQQPKTPAAAGRTSSGSGHPTESRADRRRSESPPAIEPEPAPANEARGHAPQGADQEPRTAPAAEEPSSGPGHPSETSQIEPDPATAGQEADGAGQDEPASVYLEAPRLLARRAAAVGQRSRRDTRARLLTRAAELLVEAAELMRDDGDP